jgi:hypothetical protein
MASPFLSICARAASACGNQKVMSHGAVQMQGRGQFRMRARHPSSLAIQGAEATVTVGLERAHTERLGQGDGLAIVGCSGFDLCGIVTRIELAEEP